ncbi:MAG: histidinol-phosphatase [Spirochaetia bacterium]|nr:histidinol-phosphatase [Spirochaetia bacterium]
MFAKKNMDYYVEFNSFFKELTKTSSKIIKDYFKTQISVEIKKDNSPVTIADKKAEEEIRKQIEKQFPDHGIIGEEFGTSNTNAEYQWIIDPIDGTKSFIAGIPLFGTLIALTKNKIPVLGAIHMPLLDELAIGDNKKTFINDKPVQISNTSKLEESVLLYTNLIDIERHQNLNNFLNLCRRVNYSRTWGDCCGYYLLTKGKADVMIDPIMSVWDITALIPVIQGAGGIITDYQGNTPVEAKSIVAASKNLHENIITILNS